MHMHAYIIFKLGCVDHNINYNVLKHIDITVNHIIYTCLLPLLLFNHLEIHAVKVSTEAEEPLKPSICTQPSPDSAYNYIYSLSRKDIHGDIILTSSETSILG